MDIERQKIQMGVKMKNEKQKDVHEIDRYE